MQGPAVDGFDVSLCVPRGRWAGWHGDFWHDDAWGKACAAFGELSFPGRNGSLTFGERRLPQGHALFPLGQGQFPEGHGMLSSCRGWSPRHRGRQSGVGLGQQGGSFLEEIVQVRGQGLFLAE